MTGSRRSLFAICICTAILLATGGPAMAQDEQAKPEKKGRDINDRWRLDLGTVLTDTTTDIAAGDTLSALVRIEDVLDYDEGETVFGFNGHYRFNNNKKGKHRLWFNYQRVSRDSSGTVTLEVPIFDETFTGSFYSEYKTAMFQLQYRYSFLKTNRGEAGIIAGLSTFDYDFSLSGEIDDGAGGIDSTAETADILAPIPTFGFFVAYAVRHNLIFNASFDNLDIEIGDIEGRVFNTTAKLTWYFTKHFGMGIGISGSDIAITDTGSPSFKIDYRMKAATLCLSGAF